MWSRFLDIAGFLVVVAYNNSVFDFIFLIFAFPIVLVRLQRSFSLDWVIEFYQDVVVLNYPYY